MSSTSSPPKKKKGPYPLYYGGLAASVAAACTHPLDVAKVRMQTSEAKGVVHTLIESVENDGIRRGMYTGLSASLLRQMTYSMTRFGVYDWLKEKLKRDGNSNGHPPSALVMAAAACVAGGVGGIVGNPADVVLVRMISDVNRPPDQRYSYHNALHGCYVILKDEGPSSLFLRGLVPNVARAILMSASQMATYDIFKHTLEKTGYFHEGSLLHFASSFMAGTVATTVCSPFDVIKSRVMNAAGKTNIFQVITSSVREEGFHWMFRGWLPAWIRLSPNTILIFLIYEKMKLFYDRRQTKLAYKVEDRRRDNQIV